MDKFIKGLLAGIIGAIAMDIWDFISYYVLKISDNRFLDWAAILTFGHRPYTLFGTTLALFGQIIFAGFVGVVTAYLITYTTSRYYLIKGAALGFIYNFVLYSVPIIFKLPVLSNNTALTTFSHIIGSIIWGIVTVQTLHRLDNTTRIKV